jgi:hypothetical protein
MKIAAISILLTIVILIGGCSSGEGSFLKGYDFSGIDKVAVIDVIGKAKSEAVKTQIANFFEMELLKKGYSPVERTQVQLILKEQEFQRSAITPEENAVRAGRILNVPVVMLIGIPEFGENINLTAKMLDVEDGRILWVSSGTARTGKILSTVVGAAAGAAIGTVVGEAVDEDAGDTGAIVGGVLGGAAAYTLSPQAAERARQAIGKMCKTMPMKL